MEEFHRYYLFNFFEESEISCRFGSILLNRLIMFIAEFDRYAYALWLNDIEEKYHNIKTNGRN